MDEILTIHTSNSKGRVGAKIFALEKLQQFVPFTTGLGSGKVDRHSYPLRLASHLPPSTHSGSVSLTKSSNGTLFLHQIRVAPAQVEQDTELPPNPTARNDPPLGVSPAGSWETLTFTPTRQYWGSVPNLLLKDKRVPAKANYLNKIQGLMT